MIEGIVFDFDGVITQSNYIRNNTYFDIFEKVPGSKRAMEEAIAEDLRRNREGIIRAALKKLKKKGLMQFKDISQETEKYVNKYNEITEREVSKVPEVPGAKTTLTKLSEKYPLFILTGTTQKSLEIVINNRQLTGYFKKTYGGYRNKIEGMGILLHEYKFNPKNLVFVGDGNADYECAKHYGMFFIGVVNMTNNFSTIDKIKWKVNDLYKLPQIIEEIPKNI